jgi:hypothetical protein
VLWMSTHEGDALMKAMPWWMQCFSFLDFV